MQDRWVHPGLWKLFYNRFSFFACPPLFWIIMIQNRHRPSKNEKRFDTHSHSHCSFLILECHSSSNIWEIEYTIFAILYDCAAISFEMARKLLDWLIMQRVPWRVFRFCWLYYFITIVGSEISWKHVRRMTVVFRFTFIFFLQPEPSNTTLLY